jgi:recombinational DNA repair ATPase RecF
LQFAVGGQAVFFDQFERRLLHVGLFVAESFRRRQADFACQLGGGLCKSIELGPHRDEWQLLVAGLDSRTHSSQGEQRTLALGLRLAGHRTVTESIDDEPVLLLDDVFSELDEHRGNALVEKLTGDQTLVTTAGSLPAAVEPARRLRITDGRVEEP